VAEHINNLDLFGSGGHRWVWAEPGQTVKQIQTVGADGAAAMVLANGPRPGVVAGLLKTSASGREAADTALSALERQIEALVKSGEISPWEDDHGHGGQFLRIAAYRRRGAREYGASGSDTVVLQAYECAVVEQSGNIYG
jgi:hypothetical protein